MVTALAGAAADTSTRANSRQKAGDDKGEVSAALECANKRCGERWPASFNGNGSGRSRPHRQPRLGLLVTVGWKR